MRIALTALICVLAAAAAAPLAIAHPGHAPDEQASSQPESKVHRQLKAVRDATERYRDVRVAQREGYAPTGECTASPDGGMGIHYANPRLTDDTELRIRRPEVLVYEPRGEQRRLVAVEYFVADADQRLDTDDDRPYLFGRAFDGPMEGHEPGMPIHYDLHAWVWKHNPDGVFAMWNPRVDCPEVP